MNNYLDIIKITLVAFPFVAFLITLPFILIQYHKYGSISFWKTVLVYSFVLYLMCAYFLIILPLPKISEVAMLTTPRMQLIPFKFIIDFIKESSFNITNIHTYWIALKESCFYVPIYNILLTLPFGIYLRYYFKCDLKKTILYIFLLSLFFELTQLSGLYFIYPRGYRLFDIDDLMLNTLGGLLGYLIAKPIVKKLPKMEKIDLVAREKGKKITGFKRTTAFLLDLFIWMIIEIILFMSLSKFINDVYLMIFGILIYYFIIPVFLKSRTLGEKFLNIQILTDNGENNIFRYFYRNILFIIIYFGIPSLIAFGINNLNVSNNIVEFIGALFIGVILLVYIISVFKYFFTSKKMLYEKISKTKLVSTIK
ncbi:MAG TPA: VanZ family protein [Bacilli bacterium]|nr:VanZ family protein [Bacilli bacterium]